MRVFALRVACDCGFAFLSFTTPNYSSISKGFAFSHVRRRVVARGGFFFWHRGCQKARPVGKIKPKNKRRVLTLSQYWWSRGASLKPLTHLCSRFPIYCKPRIRVAIKKYFNFFPKECIFL